MRDCLQGFCYSWESQESGEYCSPSGSSNLAGIQLWLSQHRGSPGCYSQVSLIVNLNCHCSLGLEYVTLGEGATSVCHFRVVRRRWSPWTAAWSEQLKKREFTPSRSSLGHGRRRLKLFYHLFSERWRSQGRTLTGLSACNSTFLPDEFWEEVSHPSVKLERSWWSRSKCWFPLRFQLWWNFPCCLLDFQLE